MKARGPQILSPPSAASQATDTGPPWERVLARRALGGRGKERCPGTPEGPFPQAQPCTGTSPPSPGSLHSRSISLCQGVLHSSEVHGTGRDLDLRWLQDALFPCAVQQRGEMAALPGSTRCLLRDVLWGLAFLLLVPEQTRNRTVSQSQGLPSGCLRKSAMTRYARTMLRWIVLHV